MEGESALIDAIYMLLPALEFNMTVNSNTPTLPVMKKYCVRIHIQSNCGSKSSDFSFTLDGFPKLKSFSVESNSLKQCASLIIRDSPLLKSVKVDSNCFMKAGSSLGALEITACPALAIISIGENSFNHATNVILHTLPSPGSLRNVSHSAELHEGNPDHSVDFAPCASQDHSGKKLLDRIEEAKRNDL